MPSVSLPILVIGTILAGAHQSAAAVVCASMHGKRGTSYTDTTGCIGHSGCDWIPATSKCMPKYECSGWSTEALCRLHQPKSGEYAGSTGSCNWASTCCLNPEQSSSACPTPAPTPVSSPTPAPTPVCTCSNGQKVDTCTDSSKPCKNCDAGFKLSSGTCQACAAATHHQTSGQFTGSSCTAHTDCTANIQQQKTAPTATTDRVCECTAGHELKSGASACTACTAGNFKAAAGNGLCGTHTPKCTGNTKVEFTTPDSTTDRECISCITLKGKYDTLGCAAKTPICLSNVKCANWKKLYKDSKCTCPAPASRR